jgi:hypothetical protein
MVGRNSLRVRDGEKGSRKGEGDNERFAEWGTNDTRHRGAIGTECALPQGE